MISPSFRLAALAVLAVLPALAGAQPTDPTGVAVFRYVQPGRPAAAIDVWGAVGQPGRYLVEPGLTLLDVLVLAGGPALAADDQASRTATVTVTRGAGDDRTVAARLTLDDLADGAPVPTLRDGDLVVVRTAGAGRLALPVDVWGAVGQPGRYEVALGTGLLDVLTLAGGPTLSTEGLRTETAVVSLSRPTAGGRAVVFEGSLEALASGPAPGLEAGDLVTVRLVESQRFSFRDVLGVAASVASLGLVVLRLVELAR